MDNHYVFPDCVFRNADADVKQTKKGNNRLMGMLEVFSEEETFFQRANEAISTETDTVLLEKEKVIKLWGEAYHNHEDDFKKSLSELKLDTFFTPTNRKNPYEGNEDVFFYLYLVIPNNLYSKGKFELIDILNEKLNEVQETLKTSLVKKISEENAKYYRNQEDRGRAFYEKVMDGDYGEYDYSKQLISMYKGIVASMLVSLYEKSGEKEKYDDLLPAVESFHQTNLGKRWLKEIYLVLPSEQENKEEQTEEVKEESTEENK